MSRHWRQMAGLGLGWLLLAGVDAAACTACFGNPESSQTQGMNAAILTLLGVTAGVMLVAAGIVWQIALRSRLVAAPSVERETGAGFLSGTPIEGGR